MRILGIRKGMWLALALVVAIVPVWLWFYQGRMIYLPSGYAADEIPPPDAQRLETLHFSTDAGKQVAFYVPPRAGGKPTAVWMFCVGNADRALTWRNFSSELPDPHAGALLVDYPGYGLCEGKPNPVSILASTTGAVAALARHVEDPTLADKVSVYGHSLGAAAALQYAQAHGAQRVVLIAPFTSMLAMARGRVGWPLCELLVHRFDNVAAVRALRKKDVPILVVHGQRDAVIPFAMGEQVAAAGGATFIAVPQGNHIDVSDTVEDRICAFMIGQVISTRNPVVLPNVPAPITSAQPLPR